MEEDLQDITNTDQHPVIRITSPGWKLSWLPLPHTQSVSRDSFNTLASTVTHMGDDLPCTMSSSLRSQSDCGVVAVGLIKLSL